MLFNHIGLAFVLGVDFFYEVKQGKNEFFLQFGVFLDEEQTNHLKEGVQLVHTVHLLQKVKDPRWEGNRLETDFVKAGEEVEKLISVKELNRGFEHVLQDLIVHVLLVDPVAAKWLHYGDPLVRFDVLLVIANFWSNY